ncbi:MAG: ATP-binding cassette domain-containing protein [Firmicutes bacterium]|nr:ATP-binding cassette domain-containing protein [Bacillota bacterium]
MRGDIVLEGVSKTYEGKPVLRDLSLRFEEGKVTAIMGPSGLGKTTLLKILLGLESCEGSVTGMEGRRPAVVFQESRLLPWLSLKQNLELVCGPGKDREIADALALMELTDAADKKPAELSGGMQRRGALARAIAYGGDILVLDEPFTGLDEDLKERIAGKLSRQWRESGQTVLFVTHDSTEAKAYADTIVKLNEGGSL